jgi:ankyrin repeat protein
MDDERPQEMGLTPLHRSVLQLSVTPLHTEISNLKLSSACIDDSDDSGRTALHWAAACSPSEAVTMLLQNGADPNRSNSRGRRPLDQTASFCVSTDNATALLKWGACVTLTENQGRTALSLACTNKADTKANHVGLLLKYVDHRITDRTGKTALHHAAMFNHLEASKKLIRHGVDLETRDKFGSSALLLAVHYNSHAVATTLLCSGADHRIVDDRKRSILHVAALHADNNMRNILACADLTDLNASMLDADGCSPRELFQGAGSKILTSDEVCTCFPIVWSACDVTQLLDERNRRLPRRFQ